MSLVDHLFASVLNVSFFGISFTQKKMKMQRNAFKCSAYLPLFFSLALAHFEVKRWFGISKTKMLLIFIKLGELSCAMAHSSANCGFFTCWFHISYFNCTSFIEYSLNSECFVAYIECAHAHTRTQRRIDWGDNNSELVWLRCSKVEEEVEEWKRPTLSPSFILSINFAN